MIYFNASNFDSKYMIYFNTFAKYAGWICAFGKHVHGVKLCSFAEYEEENCGRYWIRRTKLQILQICKNEQSLFKESDCAYLQNMQKCLKFKNLGEFETKI